MTPTAFEKSLQNYDSELALRWGGYMREWVVERKAKSVSPSLLRLGQRCADKLEKYEPAHMGLSFEQVSQVIKYAEEFQSARRGYRIVFFTKNLDNTVMSHLWSLDMQKHGLRKFAADEARRDYLKEKRQDAVIEDGARETADAIQFINKRNPVTAGEVNALLAQTGDMVPRSKVPKPLLDSTARPIKPEPSKGLLGMDGKPIRSVVPSDWDKKMVEAGA